MSYEAALARAIAFTGAEGLRLDSPPSSAPITQSNLRLIAAEVAGGLKDQISLYRLQEQKVAMSLGGDCGNVHHLIAKFLGTHHSSVAFNLTMGNVTINGAGGFAFSQDKFREWRRVGSGEIYDCHSWIALNDRYILDATLATYINTRRLGSRALGGVLYGTPSSLHCIPINGEPHEALPQDTTLDYEPVILGIEAFEKVAPRRV
jgi:hypothetical protein